VPGASTSVAVYDDRMEIINPGDLHFGITPKALMRPHESRPWNPIIASVFYRAGIIEKWGTGTLNIIEWCKENGNPVPQWQVRAGSVVLTLTPLRDKSDRQPESGPESQPESGVESQPESLREKVIQLLEKASLSKAEISKQLGQKQISGQLNKILKALVEEGVVSYTIPEKPTSRLQKYKLNSKFKI
jgi:ATP-dependent DNA helicase RecG